jgi:hypothetical protein
MPYANVDIFREKVALGATEFYEKMNLKKS